MFSTAAICLYIYSLVSFPFNIHHLCVVGIVQKKLSFHQNNWHGSLSSILLDVIKGSGIFKCPSLK